MKNKIVLPLILLLVGMGAGFFGGYQYRNSLLKKTAGNFAVLGANGAQRFVRGQGGGGTRMGGAVIGSILSVDNGSITVKMSDGSTKMVLLGASTTYSNTTSSQAGDLKVGGNVAVFGTPNSDGSVTATNVQINPGFGRPANPQ